VPHTNRDYLAVAFDVEGVIAHTDTAIFNQALDALRPGLDTDEMQTARNTEALYPLWVRYSVGGLDAAAYWGAVLRAVDVEPTPESLAALDVGLRRSWWGRLDAAVLAIADALRSEGLALALLSNSAPEHEATIPRFAGRFDVAHFSHRTGRRKPDPGAYTALLEDLGLDASRVLFIDDKLRNVEAARALGLQGHVFRDPATLQRAVNLRRTTLDPSSP
jgi:putative hydrolase of the HAD superfamily